MSVDLHYICPHGDRWTQLPANEFETGNWVCGEDTANEAIGGRIYLHETQRSSAWHGGRIIRWRHPPEATSKFAFTYVVDGNFRITLREGWGQERAVVRHNP